jgi:alkylation response protein AidB-like acyl-CoA dehydrogenase
MYDAQRVFAMETAERVCSDAVRILGGQGYAGKWPLEKYLSDVRALQIYEGTKQIQRIVISSML